MAIVGALVLPLVVLGMSEASATRACGAMNTKRCVDEDLPFDAHGAGSDRVPIASDALRDEFGQFRFFRGEVCRPRAYTIGTVPPPRNVTQMLDGCA
jgi:hypothetical protein